MQPGAELYLPSPAQRERGGATQMQPGAELCRPSPAQRERGGGEGHRKRHSRYLTMNSGALSSSMFHSCGDAA
jgi:hypothetical protein